MAYNNAIPTATQLISVSQGQLLGNFAAIDTGTTGTGYGFSRNHVTMTDSTNGGLHSRVDYYQAVASPTITGFISSLYPKTVTHVEAFYKNGTQDMQITNSLLAAASGQGMAPGGLQFRVGTGSLTNNATSVTISWAGAPFPNDTLAVFTMGTNQLTPANAILTYTHIDASSASIGRAMVNFVTSFVYLAIGY